MIIKLINPFNLTHQFSIRRRYQLSFFKTMRRFI